MNLSRDIEIDKLVTDISSMELLNKNSIITFVNTYSYYKLKESDVNLEKIDYIGVDGQLQVKLHNLFNAKKVSRCSFDFSSFANEFFNYCQVNKKSIALIGGTDIEIKVAVDYFLIRYPELIINNYLSGYENKEKTQEFIQECIRNEIDYLILGMGTPLQEQTAVFVKEQGFSGCIFTCGGFIFQTSQKGDYYSPIVKKLNLRWLQRFCENKEVRRRVLINYPINILRYSFTHFVLLFKKE